MENYSDKFSDMLKAVRTNRRLTQAGMAELLDITVRHYQDLERGRKKPGCEMLYRLVHVVGVSPDLVLSAPFCRYNASVLEICHLLTHCNENQLCAVRATIEALLSTSKENEQ